jgi:hypothetical protein
MLKEKDPLRSFVNISLLVNENKYFNDCIKKQYSKEITEALNFINIGIYYLF